MPLTDREKQILQEIENNLSAEDPTLARDARRRTPRMEQLRRIRLGGALFAAGFLTLILFFVVTHPLVGLAAFGAMVAGVVMIAGGTGRLANDKLNSSQPRERAIGAVRRWERALRDRFKRS